MASKTTTRRPKAERRRAEDTLPTSAFGHLYKPTPRECALLVLHLIRSKEEELGRDVSRVRISEMTLKRLWGRVRISPELIEEVSEWLIGSGLALFFAGSTFALIKTNVVESWTRVSSKRLNDDLRAVTQGRFNFAELEHLLSAAGIAAED